MNKVIESYISPKARKGLPSLIDGSGIFAVEPIKKGEVIAIKHGNQIAGIDFQKMRLAGHPELQIGDDLYIAPASSEEIPNSMIYINHSCEPNIGMKDLITFVAMHDIRQGEELTIDYAMIDDRDISMKCSCGRKNCRKIILGRDWMKKDLQKKYNGYFSPYIQKKINVFRAKE